MCSLLLYCIPYKPLVLSCFSSAIESLDSLNDQIVQFMFTPKSSECDVSSPVSETVHLPARDSLKSNLALMRRLLIDAQMKYRHMVDENTRLAKLERSQQVLI